MSALITIGDLSAAAAASVAGVVSAELAGSVLAGALLSDALDAGVVAAAVGGDVLALSESLLHAARSNVNRAALATTR
jgi:hypothetical protein